MNKETILAAKLRVDDSMDDVKSAKVQLNKARRALNVAIDAAPAVAQDLGLKRVERKPRAPKPTAAEAPKAPKGK